MESIQRDARFDNFKGLLIFLVVFGHFIQEIYGFKDENEYIRIVYSFIYLFHMPAFVFISGYFTKRNDERVFEKVLKQQIIPLGIFQVLYEIFNKLIFHGFTGATYLFAPYWMLWYLLSLASWRILFQLMNNLRFDFFISIVLALSVGFVRTLGEPLSISRTIVFFPVFILGNRCRENKFLKRLLYSCPPHMQMLKKLVAIVCLVIAFFYAITMNIPVCSYYNMLSYKELGFSLQKGLIFRFVNLILAVLCIIAILSLIPSKNSFVSVIGRNSMIPFLLHGFLLKLLVIRRFSVYSNLYFVFIWGIGFSFLVVYLCGRDKISALYNRTLDKLCSLLIKEN